MNNEEITRRLRNALDLLTNGRVAQGIEVLETIGEFMNKTDEQVEMLAVIDKLLTDDE
jgi:hypothetical protein